MASPAASALALAAASSQQQSNDEVTQHQQQQQQQSNTSSSLTGSIGGGSVIVDSFSDNSNNNNNNNNENISSGSDAAPATTDMGQEIFCGTIGGIMGRLVDYPADSVKVRYQSSTHASSCVTNCPKTYPSENVKFHHQMYIRQKKDNLTPLKVATRMWQREGFWGFYGGIASPLCGSAFVIAVTFLSFEKSKELLLKVQRNMAVMSSDSSSDSSIDKNNNNNSAQEDKLDPIWLTVSAGFLSGASRGFANTPVELLKTKVQVNPHLCPSVPAAIRVTYASAPTLASVPKYFYQGFVAMTMMSMIGNAFWFSTYEVLMRYWQEKLGVKTRGDVPCQYIMGSAALAGLSFWIPIYPIDTIKTIIQKADKPGMKMIPTFLDIMKKNPKSLYNGLALTCLRCIPANAALLWSYEASKSLYQDLKNFGQQGPSKPKVVITINKGGGGKNSNGFDY